MTNNKCPRCSTTFYTAKTNSDLTCPFCGYLIKFCPSDLRKEERAVIQRNCTIHRLNLTLTGRTINISKKGVGVNIDCIATFEPDDSLSIAIQDFELYSKAKVVWVKKNNNLTSKVGLQFIN